MSNSAHRLKHDGKILAAIIGFLIPSNLWFMPPWSFVHEMGHIVFGGGGHFVAINAVKVNYPTIVTAFAGFSVEFLFFLAVGYLLIIEKKHARLGWFFYASSFASWHQFPRSTDFTAMSEVMNAHVFIIFWYLLLALVTLATWRGFVLRLVDKKETTAAVSRKADVYLKQIKPGYR